MYVNTHAVVSQSFIKDSFKVGPNILSAILNRSLMDGFSLIASWQAFLMTSVFLVDQFAAPVGSANSGTANQPSG